MTINKKEKKTAILTVYTHFRGFRVLSPTYATAAKCMTASKAFSENILLTWTYQLSQHWCSRQLVLLGFFRNIYIIKSHIRRIQILHLLSQHRWTEAFHNQETILAKPLQHLDFLVISCPGKGRIHKWRPYHQWLKRFNLKNLQGRTTIVTR